MFKKAGNQTDKKLIELCLKGSPVAWESLVKRYKRLVYHFPNDAGLNAHDCDEVFQETFIAFYRNLEKMLEVDQVNSWLAKVAQRTTWKLLSRNRRQVEDELPEGYDVMDPDELPHDNMELKVQQAKIRQALNKMSKKCKTLLTLLFYKYDSGEYDKIAEEAGIARGSIGPTRQRCLVKFRELLENEGINKKNVSQWLK